MAPQQAGTSATPIPEGRSFSSMSSSSGRCPYHYHGHDCYELIYFSKGNAWYAVGDHEGGLRADSLFVLGPHLGHSFYTKGFLPDGRRLSLTVLWVHAHLLEQAQAVIPEIKSLSPLLARSRRGLLVTGIAAKQIAKQIGKQMGAASQQQDAAGIALIYSLFSALQGVADAPVLSSEEALNRSRDHEMARVNAICEYLQQYSTEPLSLAEVAGRFSISISTVNALLKKYRKQTFLQYLTHLRLAKAKEELQHNRLSITEVAFESGFRSIATFNRRFRQQEEITPRAYRELHR